MRTPLLFLALPLLFSSAVWAETDPEVAAYAIPPDAMQVKRDLPVVRAQREAYVYYYQAGATDFNFAPNLSKQLIAEEYLVDGHLLARTLFKEGKTYGPQRTWYPDGTLKGEWFCKDGALDGTFREWNVKGQLVAQNEMKAGQGIVRRYTDDGRLCKEVVNIGLGAGKTSLHITAMEEDFEATIEPLNGNLLGPKNKLPAPYRFVFYPQGQLKAIEWHQGPHLEWTAEGTLNATWWLERGGPKGMLTCVPIPLPVSAQKYREVTATWKFLPPYTTNLSMYTQFYTPAVRAAVTKYLARPRVKIPLEFDRNGQPLLASVATH